jgi:hypothetical protein
MEWYKSRASIELQHLATTTLVEGSKDFERLKIFYDTKPIPSVSLMEFALVNSGRSAILDHDVISQPRLTFGTGGDLLEFREVRQTPSNLAYTHMLDPVGRRVEIAFPLLNPNERIQFGVLVSGTVPTFKAEARIAGISDLTLVDKTTGLNTKTKPPRSRTGIAFLIALATLFQMAAASEYFAVRKIVQLYRAGIIRVPQNASTAAYLEFLEKVFDHMTPESRSKARALIMTLPADGKAPEERHKEIDGSLRALFERPGLGYKVFMAITLAIFVAESFLLIRW